MTSVCWQVLDVSAVICCPRIFEAGAEDRLLAETRALAKLQTKLPHASLDAWVAFCVASFVLQVVCNLRMALPSACHTKLQTILPNASKLGVGVALCAARQCSGLALSFAGAGNVVVVSCQRIVEAVAEERLAEAEGREFGHADRGLCWRYIWLVEAD